MKKILITFLLLLSSAAWGGDYEDAEAAWKREDFSAAIEKYKLAAAKGHAEAAYTVGWMYHSGTGIAYNTVEAVRWYKLAAARGNGEALSILSTMYEIGGSGAILKNDSESLRLLKLAVDKGNKNAQLRLGDRYKLGKGVAQDYGEALRLYKLAAAQGAVDWSLGAMYENGNGVTQDYVRAHMWWNLAAAIGNLYGAESRDRIVAKMTQQQISEAQKLARECQARNFKNCD